jgi:hypothetical protein
VISLPVRDAGIAGWAGYFACVSHVVSVGLATIDKNQLQKK